MKSILFFSVSFFFLSILGCEKEKKQPQKKGAIQSEDLQEEENQETQKKDRVIVTTGDDKGSTPPVKTQKPLFEPPSSPASVFAKTENTLFLTENGVLVGITYLAKDINNQFDSRLEKEEKEEAEDCEEVISKALVTAKDSVYTVDIEGTYICTDSDLEADIKTHTFKEMEGCNFDPYNGLTTKEEIDAIDEKQGKCIAKSYKHGEFIDSAFTFSNQKSKFVQLTSNSNNNPCQVKFGEKDAEIIIADCNTYEKFSNMTNKFAVNSARGDLLKVAKMRNVTLGIIPDKKVYLVRGRIAVTINNWQGFIQKDASGDTIYSFTNEKNEIFKGKLDENLLEADAQIRSLGLTEKSPKELPFRGALKLEGIKIP